MNISDSNRPTVQNSRDDANIQVVVHHNPNPERLETGEKARKMTSDFSTADQEMIKEALMDPQQGLDNNTTQSIHYGNGKYAPLSPNRGESLSEIIGIDPNKQNYEKSNPVKNYSETSMQLSGSKGDAGPHNQIGPEMDRLSNAEGYTYNMKKDQERAAEKEKHPYLKAPGEQYQDNSPQLTGENNPETFWGLKTARDDKPNAVGVVNEKYIVKYSDENKDALGKVSVLPSEKNKSADNTKEKTLSPSPGDSTDLETAEKRIKEAYSAKIESNPEMKGELKERAIDALEHIEEKKEQQESDNSSLNQLGSKVSDVKDTIQNKASDAKEIVANKMEDAKDSVQNTAQGLRDATKEAYKQVKQSDTAQKLGQKVDHVKETISKKADNLKKDVEQTDEATKDMVADNSTLQKTEEGIINLAHDAHDKIEQMRESEPMHKLRDTLVATTSLLSGAYEAVRHKVAQIVHNEADITTTKTEETIKDEIKDRYDDVKQTAEDFKEAVKDSATDAGVSSKDHGQRASETNSTDKTPIHRSDSLGEYDQFKFI
jgi:hypothetical protein